MIRRGSSRTKYPTLCWHMRMLLLALSVTGPLLFRGPTRRVPFPLRPAPRKRPSPHFKAVTTRMTRRAWGEPV